MGILCLSLHEYALICVISSFVIILKRKRELIALLLLSYGCLVSVNDILLHMLATAYDVFFRFDYEEKLLEKMVRTELQTQQVLETLDTAMNIIQGIQKYTPNPVNVII